MPLVFDDQYLKSGDKWILGAERTISYTYLTSLPSYYSGSLPQNLGITSSTIPSPFSPLQLALAEIARESWSSVANFSWVEQVESGGIIGDVTLGISDGIGASFATFPHLYKTSTVPAIRWRMP